MKSSEDKNVATESEMLFFMAIIMNTFIGSTGFFPANNIISNMIIFSCRLKDIEKIGNKT